MAKHNRPVLPQSTIIDLKGRPVGSEDLESAALMLQWAENSGYKGKSLTIASNVALGLRLAVELSLRGEHEKAAKQAGNVLYVLKKDRVNSKQGNYRCVGDLVIDCRDGQKREVGAICTWFMGVHNRIHEQINQAKAEEAEALANSELEALQFAASVATGQALQSSTEKKAKAA
jgi:hypothetical protein